MAIILGDNQYGKAEVRLVGSEMCIRDRTRELAGGLSARMNSSRAFRKAARSAMSVRNTVSLTTVSYTHLTLPTKA